MLRLYSMMPSTSLLGVLFALASAAVWGGGDFTGGLATRRDSQYHVLAIASFSGMLILLACVVLWREALPSWRSILWSALAGASGAVGIAALYRALSLGHAATVAPTAAVISAAMPAGFSAVTEGLPAVTSNPTALLAGVLDAGGNIFYLLARQFVRLDVAAVLASLYPVSTVILARVLLKESVSRQQWAGVAVCLSAIVLITV